MLIFVSHSTTMLAHAWRSESNLDRKRHMNDIDPQARNELGHRLLQSIRRIVRRIAVHSRKMAVDTGLTVPQLLVMRAIRELSGEEVSLASVAARIQLSRSTVSAILERLVRADLVRRDRSTRDRRRVNLTLTRVGEECLDSLPGPLQDRFLKRIAALPHDEQEQLLDSLERVVELMDADELDAAPMLVPGAAIRPADDPPER